MRWLAALALLVGATEARADGRSKFLSEVAEAAVRKFGKESMKEGVEAFTKRLATASAKHGDDVAKAVQRVGPRGLHAVEEAGEHGGKMARLITTHGDDAVVWVAKHPSGLKLLAKHGDDAGAALCKHKGIAAPMIESLGEPAAKALAQVGPQGGRRLAIMADSGDLARIGKTEQLLGVVGKFGERALAFIWDNKGKLAVAAVLATFLSNPEPYINGAVKLAEPMSHVPGKVVDSVAAPLAAAEAQAVVGEAAPGRSRWPWVAGGGVVGALLVAWFSRRG